MTGTLILGVELLCPAEKDVEAVGEGVLVLLIAFLLA